MPVWFKTKKIKTTVWNFKKSILFLTWFISIWVICFLWISIVKNIKNFDFNFNLWSIISSFKFDITPNQSDDNKIKILLVWRWWANHNGWNLTDSIILASIDLDKKIISMLSIPRDLYVKYDNTRYGKINWIYASYLSPEKGENQAMEYLKNKISQITWEKIDYYVNIDFSWFKQIVDLLWWVTVEVSESIADYTYPTPSWWYTTFILKKWTWLIDWETALKYARSRHTTSDFDRSLRQHKILSAIKEKMISEGYFKNPIKIKKMYNTISPYFTTDIWLNWILKIASDFEDLWDKDNIISLNLNNSCVYWASVCAVWWILYTPPMEQFWWASVVIPRWASYYSLEKYGEIQRFSNIIFNYSWVFTNKQEINIFNSMPVANQALYLANDLQQFGFNIPEKDSIWNTDWVLYEQTTILYNNLWDNTETLDALKLFIKWKYEKIEKPRYSKNPNTKIEIIIWKDLKDITDFNWEEKEE